MKILKFTGATNREVLGQVRASLGEDALIISSRRADSGQIEILAADPASISAAGLAPAEPPAAARPPQPRPPAPSSPGPATPPPAARAESPAIPATIPPAIARAPQPGAPRPAPQGAAATPIAPLAPASPVPAVPAASAAPLAPAPLPARAEAGPAAASPPAEAPAAAPRQAEAVVAAPAAGPDIAQALSSLQGELARRFDGLMWGSALKRSPQRTTLLRELLEAGFSTTLARELLSAAPGDLDAHAMRQWLRQALIARLPTAEPGREMLAQPGTYALIGPTGVGKTTTVAKLAARCIELHGRGSLALVTTDSYRIAAHEQLQTFGRIMGVPVFPMRSDADLRGLLQRLSDKAVVLIDNIGLSQRDSNVSRQLALLSQAGLPVQRVLVLNAASQGDTLEEVARVYGSTASANAGAGDTSGDAAHGAVPLLGCIVTKLDEAARTGSVLDTAIRHGLAIQYVSDGQKVPENLRQPVGADLIDQALVREGAAPALYVPDEAGLAALADAASRPAGPSFDPASGPSSGPPPAGAAGVPGGAVLRTWLPWLLHRAEDVPAEQVLGGFDAGLAWARRDTATRLAREAWRHWSLHAGSRASPAAAAGQAAPHLLADHWSKAAQDAAAGAVLLAVHGKASLAPQLPRAALSGALLASEDGQILSTPAQALTSQFGHYSIADQGDEPHELPLRRLRWLERELPRVRRVHLFDSVAAGQWTALQHSGADWLALASGSLKVHAVAGSDEASAAAEPLKTWTADATLTPLESDPAAAGGDEADGNWWIGERPVSLRPAAASPGEAPPPALRLLVLRRATARPGSADAATHLLLANIPAERASAARLVHWFLAGQRLRQAFRYMAPAWYALGSGPEENGVWLRRALLAGQVGAAAWQAAQASQAAPLRGLLAATGGWQRQASARHTVEALLRTFAMMELAQ